MYGWKKHWFIEGGFLVALLVMCIVLTTLQRRWLGDLDRAASRQQNTQLRSQAQLFCHTFDSQLDDACAQLRPSGKQIETVGHAQAHAQCLQRWQAGSPRPMFRRLAVVVLEGKVAGFYLLDQKTAQLVRSEWPPEWAALETNLAQRVNGGPPKVFEDPAGLLREYPVFGGRGPGQPGRPGEIEWVIMELDPDYVRKTWLPELAQNYFNPGRQIINDVMVTTQASPPRTVFSTGGSEIPTGSDPVLLGFNNKARGGPPDGAPPDGGPGGDGPPDGDPPDGGPPGASTERNTAWTLYAWPRAGEFAAALSKTRSHDFLLACVLDGCLLVGGLLIIHYARRARRLGDARLQFIAAVSHELRTPLTVIRGAGQGLRRGIASTPERINTYADLIVEHSERLAEMVEQVLSFAGARRNASSLARKPVAVSELIEQAIAACASDTQAAGCEVQATLDRDLPPVLGDAHALRRVFQNLLTNAAKHGGRGKWIGVCARHINGSTPGCVEIEVTDRGEGIPSREQPHVFEPFFRGSRARGDQTRGSGIGLSVVREIVKVHGGSVRVESHANQGTRFTVSLPVAGAAQVERS